MTKAKVKSLTPEQLTRGIYIDFEGFTDKTPTLLGVLIEDQFKQYVFDTRLREAAKCKSLECVGLRELVRQTFNFAKSQDRYLVAWSNHEMNVIREFADIDISDRYFNPIKTARRWYFRTHGATVPGGASLANFMKHTKFQNKSHLVKGKATKWIRVVSEQLDKKESFEKLTPTAKRFWTNLLNYNQQDCEALRHIAMVTSTIGDSQPSRKRTFS